MTFTSEFFSELKGLAKSELTNRLDSVKSDVTDRLQSKLDTSSSNYMPTNNSPTGMVTAFVTKEGNDTVMYVKKNAQKYASKRIKRLQARARTAAKREILLQEAREGVLRIDDTELEEPRTSFSSKIIDRLASVNVNEYKPW